MADHTPVPPTAQTRVRAMKIVPHRSDIEPFLLLEVEIDCPTCGEVRAQFLGHHLRGLAAAFQQILGQYPELCPAEALRKGDEWSGTVMPGKETLN